LFRWYAFASSLSVIGATFVALRLYEVLTENPFANQTAHAHAVQMRSLLALQCSKRVAILIFICKIAIAAGFYQIKIPGVTPDRIKLGMR
jgi:hypothetical protein